MADSLTACVPYGSQECLQVQIQKAKICTLGWQHEPACHALHERQRHRCHQRNIQTQLQLYSTAQVNACIFNLHKKTSISMSAQISNQIKITHNFYLLFSSHHLDTSSYSISDRFLLVLTAPIFCFETSTLAHLSISMCMSSLTTLALAFLMVII